MEINEIKDKFTSDSEFAGQLVSLIAESEKGKEIISNFTESAVEERIKTRVSEFANNVEKDVFEVAGVAKLPNEKYYDYLKRVIADFKGRALPKEELQQRDQKIQELEDKLKNSKSGEFWHKEYQGLTEQMKAKEQEYQAEIEKFQTERKQSTILSEIEKGLSSIKLNEALSESTRSLLLETAKEKLLKSADVQDGKVLFMKEGNIWNKDFAPIKAQDALREILGDSVSKETPSGVTKPGGTTGGGPASILHLDPNSIKTQADFQKLADKALKEAGVAYSGKADSEYQKQYKEAFDKFGVKGLPLQ